MLRKLVLAWMFTLVIFVLVGCEGGGTDSITPTVTLAASLEQPEATPTAPIVITPKIEPTPTLSKNQTITLARVFPTPGLPENRLNPSKPISIGAWFFIDITKSMTDYCTFSVLGDQFDPNGDRQSIRSELPKFFTAAIGKMPDRFDGDNSFIGVKVFDSKPEIVKPFERVGEYNNINWEDFREQVNPLKPEDAVSFEDVLESVPITDTLHTRVDPEPFDRKMIVMITDGFMGSSSEYYSPQNTRNEVRQKIINLSNQGVEVFAVLVNCPALLEDRDLKSNYEQDLFYWDALQGGGYANIIKLADYTSPIRAAVESILGEYFDFEFDLDEAYGSVGQGFGRSWLTFSKRPKVDYSGNDGKAIIEVPGKAERVDLWINPTHRVKNIEYGKDGEDIDVLYPDNTLFENTTDPNKKLIPLEGCAPHEIAIDPKPEDNLYPLDVHVSWQVTFPSFEIQEINVFSDDHSIAAGDEGDSKVLNKITNNQNFFVEVSVAQWDSVSETYGELVEGFSDCYDISVVIDLPNGEIFQEIIDLDNISRTDTISVLSGITPTIS
ncbi:MAG: vWA domain-containing protein, partial [Anaerolineales bacterium]